MNTEIPTPETDEAWANAWDEGGCYPESIAETSRDLERRLAIARDALEWANMELGKCTKPNRITEALTQTAPKL